MLEFAALFGRIGRLVGKMDSIHSASWGSLDRLESFSEYAVYQGGRGNASVKVRFFACQDIRNRAKKKGLVNGLAFAGEYTLEERKWKSSILWETLLS